MAHGQGGDSAPRGAVQTVSMTAACIWCQLSLYPGLGVFAQHRASARALEGGTPSETGLRTTRSDRSRRLNGRWPTNLQPVLSLCKVIEINFNGTVGCMDDM